MDGSSFYVLETKGSTLLNDMLDETENITKQADRISLIQSL